MDRYFDHFANASKRNGNIAWSSDGMGGADELVHTLAEAQVRLATLQTRKLENA